jgi:hypothetical protein
MDFYNEDIQAMDTPSGKIFGPYSVMRETPKLLVVGCSDHRFHFRGFIEEYYGLSEGQYHLILFPGGLAPLAHPHMDPAAFAHEMKKLRVVLDSNPSITKFGSISHQSCGWYREHLPGVLEREDTIAIGRALREDFPNHTVNTFFAPFADNNPTAKVFFVEETIDELVTAL